MEDRRLLLATNSPFASAKMVLGDGGLRLEVTNLVPMLKAIKQLDDTWAKQLRKEFVKIAKPVNKEIRSAIPSKNSPPLSGMTKVHFGRLAWGSTHKNDSKISKSTKVQVINTAKRKYRGLSSISIVRVQVQSPGTVMADMAGRNNKSTGKNRITRPYDYMYTKGGLKVPGIRQHRLTRAQGMAFIMNLKLFGRGLTERKASRMIWPAADKALPKAQREIKAVIDKTNMIIEAKLRSMS